jgi:hypothetical protein
VRKIAYHEISKLRHKLNDAPRREPNGNESFDEDRRRARE